MFKSSQSAHRHFTTRYGFAIFLGLLVLALYVLWASYGAAPTSFSFLAEAEALGGHGGHGATAGGMTPEEFEEATYNFIDKFALPDGSVRPVRSSTAVATRAGGRDDDDGHHDEPMAAAHDEPLAAMPTGGHDDDSDHDEPMGAGSDPTIATRQNHGETTGHDDDHGNAAESDEAAHEGSDTGSPALSSMAQAVVVHGDEDEHTGDDGNAHAADGGEEPIDVYVMARQYVYEPSVLRLERGVAYRFRMMSMDVNHGASIHTGFAGHIMRRPAQTMVDMVMTFTERGEYMMYCTVYCGEGHSTMKGKIIVE